jgi:hypothetical protein
MTLTLFIGGPKNGDFYDIDYGKMAHAIWAPEEPNFTEVTDFSTARPKIVTYLPQKIATPDGWIEPVLVYEGIDLTTFTEPDLIKIIMTGWRARHAHR